LVIKEEVSFKRNLINNYVENYKIYPGVKSIQIFRANRFDSNHNWTFNHSPMIGYHKGRFFVSFISNPIHETLPPSKVMLSTSTDSKEWGEPIVLFPPYQIDNDANTFANLHHRIGFHTRNNRFFALAYYGISRDKNDFPNNGNGIGSVIREIYFDGTFGQIYFLKLNSGWSRKNIKFPHFTESDDENFISICNEFLNNPILSMKFKEELPDYTLSPELKRLKAFSYYKVDEKLIGFWKWGYAIQIDEKHNWSKPYKIKNMDTNGGKIWAEKFSENKYSLIFNPTKDNINRWPLSIATSENGYYYSELMNIIPYSPPRRYYGYHKSLGASYPSGLGEYSEHTEDNNIQIVYSVNKEDIWISILPKHKLDNHYNELNYFFSNEKAVNNFWNDCCVYMPKNSKFCFSLNPYTSEPCLLIEESERYDRFKLDKYFKKCKNGKINISLMVPGNKHPILIKLFDDCGSTSFELKINYNLIYTFSNEPHFILEKQHNWINLEIAFNSEKQTYKVYINKNIIESGKLNTTNSIERISIETKNLPQPNPVKDINLLSDLNDKGNNLRQMVFLKQINLII
jgi:hypothetical protein